MKEIKMATKAPVQVETVTMQDGNLVEFPGKRMLVKSHSVTADGTVQVRLDFRNGEFRIFTLPTNLLARFAAHGAEQKLGDATAGLSLEDSILAIDDLIETLYEGNWTTKREASGFAGASILARALVETTGKSIETVKAYLKGLTVAQRNAMKANSKIAPVVARLEAAAAAKKGVTIDSDELLASL